MQALSLPFGEIGILNTKLGKRTGLAAFEVIVNMGQFTEEDSYRPAVKYDVMDGQEEYVLITLKFQ